MNDRRTATPIATPSAKRVLLAAVAAAAAFAAGCRGERADASTYEGPFAAEVREAIPKIERAAGVPFKRPPKVEARSSAEVRAFLEHRFEDERTKRELAGQVAAYKRFGLLPDTLDVRQLMLDLLTEQIVGFYDPETEVLYVVEDGPKAMRETVIQHELVHALQDQYMSLDSLQKIEGNNDLVTAIQAMIEGQAVYEQLQAMLGGGDVMTQLPGGWDRVRTSIRQQQTNMPLFSAAPMAIQETLIFPYLSGAEYVRRRKLADSVPVLQQPLPVSTEQILHAEAMGDSVDMPTRIQLPPPSVGRVVYENNLGEFETRLVLYQWSRDQAASIRAAAGWDGDRYVLFDTPQGQGLAWLTVWDGPVDAAEFYDVIDLALRKRYRDLRAENTSPQERRYTGGDRAMRVTATEVGGRPAVLYVDMPRGARTDDVLDLSRVRLSEEQPLHPPAPTEAPAQ
ncbi:MAG TPA: hypothetical protein VFX39_09530 [Gemmatimonadaceae bacterium]|nr:hypothetical protein [Gemmatimonadaceae bacterium]